MLLSDENGHAFAKKGDFQKSVHDIIISIKTCSSFQALWNILLSSDDEICSLSRQGNINGKGKGVSDMIIASGNPQLTPSAPEAPALARKESSESIPFQQVLSATYPP